MSLKNYEIPSNFTKFKNQNFCIVVLKKLSNFYSCKIKIIKTFLHTLKLYLI
ncbi:hypothetical protein CHAB381_1367 [Campylobacter hominis ATCC BAA-381]|uniref:Uncharacterized protein n=1 Tax=Campylobacter hominis (strain ATCC BAA-381 / DSM 21671 / CCUG 45161 / LMG 19568 / NCTC 13146 / CH001A) TaxID=360107 RepID=A7I325_CAMHC|nr:hypothetical protein CHAB381_1367 [Campylobacter hominis ATCC BAA-381]